jgi:hypothetical protein
MIRKKSKPRPNFDGVFKRLMQLSARAMIQFINKQFGTHYPSGCKVSYPNTESRNRKGRKRLADIIIRIAHNGEHDYLVEAQTKDDPGLVIRVFEYGLGLSIQRRLTLGKKGREGNRLIFPEPKIFYLEADAPDEEELVLDFGTQGTFTYKVPTVKLFEHSIAELEELGLTILLPFYVLKLRHEVARARESEIRASYAAQMREIVIELEEAVARGKKTQGMNASDTRIVLDHIDELLINLYSEYEEFEEVSGMVAGTLLTASERAEKRATEQRDKFWKKKLDEERQKAEAERQKAEAAAQQKAEAERKKADIKLVKNLRAKGWQYAEIAKTLDLDVKTVRLYARS